MAGARFGILIVDLISTLFAVVFLIMMVAAMKLPEPEFLLETDREMTASKSRTYKALRTKYEGTDNPAKCSISHLNEGKNTKFHWVLFADDRITMFDPISQLTKTVFSADSEYQREIQIFLTAANTQSERGCLLIFVGSFNLYYDVQDKLQSAHNLSWSRQHVIPNDMSDISAILRSSSPAPETRETLEYLQTLQAIPVVPTKEDILAEQRVREKLTSQMRAPAPNIRHPPPTQSPSSTSERQTIDMPPPPRSEGAFVQAEIQSYTWYIATGIWILLAGLVFALLRYRWKYII